MDYIEVAKKRMAANLDKTPLDSLINNNPSSIFIEDYYGGESYDAVIVEDSSTDFTDEKILYTHPDKLSEGDVITWQDTKWIVSQEELNTVGNYNKFYISECIGEISFLVDGRVSNKHPIAVLKSTFGVGESRTSARYSIRKENSSLKIIVNKNNETSNLKTEDELIINKKVWQIKDINSYISNSVIIFELDVAQESNMDDIDGGIANTYNAIDGSIVSDGYYSYMIVGSPTIKENSYKEYEAIKVDENGTKIEPSLINYTTSSNLITLTTKNKKAIIHTSNELGIFTIYANIDGKSINANIEIVDFWG